ncbi:MAG TPA: peroxidase family protein [Vicinamibacterales bacterium]|nr:peroxidase family protein [Vicinamibacterales bacterium]
MVFDKVRDREWFDQPRGVAGIKLVQLRDELREKNLHDTEEPPLGQAAGQTPPEAVASRTVDGTFNDLSCPLMGSAGTRFGRNVPLSETFPDTANLLTPNPRTVSRELFTRTAFQPATGLNVLAAAWIQFQVHDWFVHQKGSWSDTHDIPLNGDDTWHERPMRVPKTPVDPPKVSGSTRPPAYINENSHWWDGSQVYGSNAAVQKAVRTGADGKLRIGTDGRLLVDPESSLEITGVTDNGWVGLSLLHGLFALEHNAICDLLKRHNPSWNDEQLFQRARLVNGALIAKIHTVDWSTAILSHPVVQKGLRANWEGVLGDTQKIFPGLNDNDLLAGIPGSPTDHHSAPYSLTEEFAAVYRMHPLMPDDFVFRSAADGSELARLELPDLSGRRGRQVLERFSPTDLLYSLGVSHPGAIRLHNYPRHLQNLVNDKGERFDVATIDILRDRERGVPRYNQFRRLIHKRPVESFEELTDNPLWAEEIKHVYDHDIEKVDLMVGLMAEPLPEGFGFSDTAFRIFLLMASRRLKSDRFLSKDFRPEVYTKQGIDWVQKSTMIDVLKRHFPDLKRALDGRKSAFHPWNPAPARPAARR